MNNVITKFAESLGDFLDKKSEGKEFFMPLPMEYDGWGECLLFLIDQENTKEIFGENVNHTYRLYILNNGTVAICTALSEKHNYNDKAFMDNYRSNFNQSPHGDIEFFNMYDAGEYRPFICFYANNIYKSYEDVIRSGEIDKSKKLEFFYDIMLTQLIEYIENVRKKIIKPYN